MMERNWEASLTAMNDADFWTFERGVRVEGDRRRKLIQEKHEREGTCNLCGLPMPKGEEAFRFHGYSITCEQAAVAPSEGDKP